MLHDDDDGSVERSNGRTVEDDDDDAIVVVFDPKGRRARANAEERLKSDDTITASIARHLFSRTNTSPSPRRASCAHS